ncbi:hypothetical protein FQR65_LT05462 [Abscondita terminalis]|nr:hypothetical protein FQR65_LT05462 [Abscondita terminalis]
MNLKTNQNDGKGKKKLLMWFDWIPTRVVFYLLTLNGIMATFILRTAINLTILAMVKEKPVDPIFKVNKTLCLVKNLPHTTTLPDYKGTLDWSVDEQYYVLASFYWTYVLSQVFGGIAAKNFGTKKVFGLSVFISSLVNLCVPICSTVHYILVVILQLISGFVQGLTWPAVYSAISVWMPIQERSRFVSCFQGFLLGTMLGNIISAVVIAYFGWVYVFYITGVFGLLSTLLWYLLMHDKPEQHPRISQQELKYIQINREQSLHLQKVIPWWSILTSLPVWAVGITSSGRMWLVSTIIVYGPLYLKTIGLTVEQNGLVNGMSWFVDYFAALIFCFVSDKIIQYKLIPLVYNRKIFSGIGQIIPGIMALVIGYINCNIPLIITVWFLMKSFIGANFPGGMSNIVDISPNYTGPVSSIVQILLLLPTVLTTLVVKTLLKNENSLEAWRKIFCINGCVIIATYLFYVIFASGKAQPWDFPKKDTTKEEVENDDITHTDNAP